MNSKIKLMIENVLNLRRLHSIYWTNRWLSLHWWCPRRQHQAGTTKPPALPTCSGGVRHRSALSAATRFKDGERVFPLARELHALLVSLIPWPYFCVGYFTDHDCAH